MFLWNNSSTQAIPRAAEVCREEDSSLSLHWHLLGFVPSASTVIYVSGIDIIIHDIWYPKPRSKHEGYCNFKSAFWWFIGRWMLFEYSTMLANVRSREQAHRWRSVSSVHSSSGFMLIQFYILLYGSTT